MAQPWSLYIDAVARTVWQVKVEMRRRGVFARGCCAGRVAYEVERSCSGGGGGSGGRVGREQSYWQGVKYCASRSTSIESRVR